MFILEVLDKNIHNRKYFESTNKELNHYFIAQASQDMKRSLATTFVAVKPGSTKIYGYFSLSSYSIIKSELNLNDQKGIPYDAIPAILIGRLAIQKDQTELKGYELLGRALLECKKISKTGAAARIVVVDAVDDQALRFYLRQGFLKMGRTRRLYFPVASID